jgi:hypothetical protein
MCLTSAPGAVLSIFFIININQVSAQDEQRQVNERLLNKTLYISGNQ